MFRAHLGPLLSCAALLAVASAATAQNLSGSLSDSTTGPVTPGVHLVTAPINVPLGQALTIQPGAILKFQSGGSFHVYGTLNAPGTVGSGIILTDVRDDTAGGDSNANGPSSGSPGWWYGLFLEPDSDASALSNVEVRFAGYAGRAGFEFNGSNATLGDCSAVSCNASGIDLNNSASFPTITGSSVQGCGGVALRGVRLQALPGFTDNTASLNAVDALLIEQATLTASCSIGPQNGINGVIRFSTAISVPAAATLQVAAGTVLKMDNGTSLTVDGTLELQGARGNPVYITEGRDDTLGGDSNGDGGASAPSPGRWYGVFLNDGADASQLAHFELRYTGYAGYSALELANCDATIIAGTVRDANSVGIDLNSAAGPSYPTVSNCSVLNCNSFAIRGVRLDALPGFSNNSASGNAFDALFVDQASLAFSTSVAPANGINGAFVANTSIAVPGGKVLSLQAGTVVKLAHGASVTVDGTLTTTGAAGGPVVFTDYRDDTLGGDSNGNGSANGPGAGHWYGVFLNDGADASSLLHTEVRYAGYAGYAALRLNSCSATLTSVTVANANAVGIDLSSSASYPTVTGCKVRDSNSFAVRGVRLDAVPGFTNTTATGNAFNAFVVDQATLGASVVIGPQNGIGRTLVLTQSVSIGAGTSLTLLADTVLKLPNGGTVDVDGALITQGTGPKPVIFTDQRDDSAGGDTNGNGPSSGSPGSWYGVFLNPTSDASALDYFEVRYGGYAGYSGVEINGSDCSLTRGIVRDCNATAIDLNGTQARPRINRCHIRDNGSYAIAGAAIDALPYITKNTGSGNGFDQIQVVDGTPAGDLYIEGGAGVNDVIVMATSLSVPAGLALRLGPGAAFKMPHGSSVQVDGTLIAEGLAGQPVVFTDARDDSVGGDSNGNGTSTGSPGYWYGLFVGSGATQPQLDNVLIRFSGYAGYPGVTCSAASASLTNCRVERSNSVGFMLHQAARAEQLAAYQCGSTGVRLQGGAFDLRQATVHACAFGIQINGTGWSGSVVDSIAWGNTTDFSNVPSNQVRYSCGYAAGGLGNISVDPLFVNPAIGDLRLSAGSPCIGTGDPFSRLDADCSAADMGAYPALGPQAPVGYCSGKQNSAGCTPYMAATGNPSASASQPFWVRGYNVLSNKSGLLFYGLSGRASAPFQGGFKCVADPVRRLPLQSSGGHANLLDCSGVISVDFNALIQGGTDPQLVAGSTVGVQCWYRDPGMPSGTGLSDGIEFRVCN